MDERVLKIWDYFRSHPDFPTFHRDLKRLVISSKLPTDGFKEEVLAALLVQTPLVLRLKNVIFHWLRKYEMSGTNTGSQPYEAFFRKSQIQWDKRIHKSLNSMCTELGIPLAKVRPQNEREELTQKWGEISILEVDIHKYRPVYAPKDFLEVLLNLKGPIGRPEANTAPWQFSQIPLRVKGLQELRSLYVELSKWEFHIGSVNSTIEMDRIHMGEKIVEENYAPLAQEFLKKGCPAAVRAKIWTMILNADVTETETNYFESLKDHVLQYDLMIDKLIIKDIALTASNDDQYFVFEDVLYQVMLCFSRDSDIMKDLPSQPGFMQVTLKGTAANSTVILPPSGVVPFHGFTMYAAPFCYLFDRPIQLYFMFRAFYLRYWHRLHRVCSHPQGIVSLCLQYERMLQCFEPALWYHLNKCHIHPIRLVIKWLMRAFSGHLTPEQLLNLWDIILAYDSLEILPLLAVSILVFRRENLLKVTTLQNIEAVLADLSSINVVVLLQMALTPPENY